MPLHDSSCMKLLPAFVERILSTLRDDEVGKLSCNDETILLFGSKQYKRLEFKKTKLSTITKTIRGRMRILAKIYFCFRSMDDVICMYGNSLDMFMPKNFEALCAAITTVTENVDGSFKPGLRQNSYYVIKRAAKIFRAHFSMKEDDDRATLLERFQLGFDGEEDILVAGCQLEKTWLLKTRKP